MYLFPISALCCASSCTTNRVKTPKEHTVRQGGSWFFSSLLISPNPREPAEDWKLKVFFLPLIQGTRVKCCASACLPKGDYSVNVSPTQAVGSAAGVREVGTEEMTHRR